MKRVGKFLKVSRCEFAKSFENFSESRIDEMYGNLKLPERATKGSAGYDFFMPYDITLNPNETAKIPTGIRVEISEGWVLKLYPRSSLGFKYRLQLDNTVGIIDSDYFYSDNEGHIFAKITNNSDKTLSISANDGFMQGIFIEYGITFDDDANAQRNGGFGSTNKN